MRIDDDKLVMYITSFCQQEEERSVMYIYNGDVVDDKNGVRLATNSLRIVNCNDMWYGQDEQLKVGQQFVHGQANSLCRRQAPSSVELPASAYIFNRDEDLTCTAPLEGTVKKSFVRH